MRPEATEAEALRRMAEGDEAALRELVDSVDVPDFTLGFHAQQAVEKLLKAILIERGVTFTKVHDLVYLLDRVAASGLEIPDDVAAVAWLQPYAVTARYELPFDDETLDRAAALALVVRVRAWSKDLRA